MPDSRCCTPQQVTQLRRVANKAKRDAERFTQDERINRSTRTRAAYKAKADALDKIQKILG